jgi:uncharacterized protein (TIGR02284 family)
MSATPISTLQHLAEISRDGKNGFLEAAQAVKDRKLQETFRAASARCEIGAKELDREIIRLGGSATDAGTLGGAVHRVWSGLKSAITGGGDRAILEECERGEDVAKAAYEEALETDLTPDLSTLVRRQYVGVVENHDLIKRLRDSAAH